MSDGWNCPHCGKAHGPHIDTCPEQPFIPYNPLPYPGWHEREGTVVRDCGCPPNTPCGSVICPRSAGPTICFGYGPAFQ